MPKIKSLKQSNIIILFLFLSSLLYFSCDKKPVPEKLPKSVRKNLNLLQKDPQFVMYINIRSMRTTEFWKDNISDSLLNAERTFGSMLNTFKIATGASVSDGLDEFYYSNSWIGENAIVLKGVFDLNKLNTFLESDTLFTKNDYENGMTIYMNPENNLYFFFKDNFTLCASNYMKQIDEMIKVMDTSRTGLLLNEGMIKAIEETNYKNNLWMVSTEQSFIRGIFVNFVESKIGDAAGDSRFELDSLLYNEEIRDSIEQGEDFVINKLYKGINSISFSAKMRDDLKFLVQFDCMNEKTAQYLDKVLSGMLAMSKLSSAFQKEHKPSVTEKILNSIDINIYDTSVFIYILITNENISDFRKNMLFTKPD
jgi:hypothetical protein